MASPTYSTDLQTVDLAEAIGTWQEMSSRKSGGAPVVEDRAYIQGVSSISQSTGAATGRTTGVEFDYGSNITLNTGEVFTFWQYWQAPAAIGLWADGGMRAGVGASAGSYSLYNTQGSDFGRNPFGGWSNTAIDPTGDSDETEGAASGGSYRWFGSTPYMLSSVSKGNPHCVDAIRYGRGQIKTINGDTGAGGPGTFVGMSNLNDGTGDTTKYGLFQGEGTGYLWKGLMQFGDTTNSCHFVDANVNITVDHQPRTYADFNKIQVLNASTIVDWTSIGISAVSYTTAVGDSNNSPGTFEVGDSATTDFTTCTFTDMDVFTFDANSSNSTCTWRRCKRLVQNNATFSTCTFDSIGDSASMLVSNLSNISNCNFTSNGSGYAMELTSAHAGGEYTLSSCTYSGYATDSGDSVDRVIYNNSGGAVTINIVGGNTPSVRNGSGASTTLVINPVTLTINIRDIVTGDTITAGDSVRALVWVGDSSQFPYYDTVSITGSGTTATVTHGSHGLATNDDVIIRGAEEDYYNGAYSITVTGDSTYTYTANETLTVSPATGTITSTLALINDTTLTGRVTDTRSYGDSQDIAGWIRKADGTPYYYQSQSVTGTVNPTGGANITVQLVRDE